jgi:hypothetical protein
MPPLLMASLAGLLVTWVTFTPCFLCCFLVRRISRRCAAHAPWARLCPRLLLPLLVDADNIRLDPQTGRLIIGYGSGGLAVFDPLCP